ncbi:replication protein A 70 kDa DNA-binding subunit B [Tanacetum coccineum]
MEMNPTQLCDLDPMNDDTKILGNRVQVSIKGKHISKFQLILDEGACYRIGNFDVGENSRKWPLLSHKYKLNFFQGTTVTRVGSFDNNPRGFKFEHFSSFTSRTFTERELCDVIGTVVSVSNAIPFNNYGKDQLRRTIILEDLSDREKEGFDPANHTIALLTPVKKEVTADDFFKGAIKNTVGSIRDSDGSYHCILYAKIHKIHRENGWTYLACKKYGRSAKEVESDESSSSGKRTKKQQLWNCRVHKGLTASLVHMRFKVIVRVIDDTRSAYLLLFDDLVFYLTNGEQCHKLIQTHGPNYDDYFPPELNVLDAEDDLHTPVLGTANSSRFSNVANIPFNIEESLKAADGTSNGNETNQNVEGSSSGTKNDGADSGSGKRTIINLDDFDEEAAIAKRAKHVIQVKLEPAD